ncbi:MAG TPA: phosphoribosyltransferase [Acidimicrobiales bacterium]|jgi:putative phosphoribosyl transferase|nr:phosphoribosyltransferase [Acidimicrobiales bacterium]
MRFRDRLDAGRQLAAQLRSGSFTNPIVLALPRGGVPVAAEVARELGAPLEVFVARKIGAPWHPEFGIGAIAEGGARVRDDLALRTLGLSTTEFDTLANREQDELERRVRHYRGNRSLPDLAGRDVILVDDGLATGVTAAAALHALRECRPHRLILAAPACSSRGAEDLRKIADDVLCVFAPESFVSVGQWYRNFSQTTDEEVLQLLEQVALEQSRR